MKSFALGYLEHTAKLVDHDAEPTRRAKTNSTYAECGILHHMPSKEMEVQQITPLLEWPSTWYRMRRATLFGHWSCQQWACCGDRPFFHAYKFLRRTRRWWASSYLKNLCCWEAKSSCSAFLVRSLQWKSFGRASASHVFKSPAVSKISVWRCQLHSLTAKQALRV